MGLCQQSKWVSVQVKVDVYAVSLWEHPSFPTDGPYLPKKNKYNCESEVEAIKKQGRNVNTEGLYNKR